MEKPPPATPPRAGPPQLTLRYPSGDRVLWVVVPPAGLSIGRRGDCGIVLPAPEVSREHARIRLEGGRWLLCDLGSANGTWIDGERIAERALADGDRIRIDRFEIECWLDDPAAPPAPDPGLAAAGSLFVGDFDAVVSQVLREPAPAAAEPPDDRTRIARPGGPAAVDLHDPLGILQVVHHATDALLEHDVLAATLERVVGLVFEHLPAERCVVLLADPDTGRLVPCIERAAQGAPPQGLRISRHIADMALRTQQAVLVRDTSADERFARVESIVALRICSGMCAPMCHRGRVSGLIYVDRTGGGAVFGNAELGMLSLLATVSAAAVERARMRASLERERRVRERLGRYHAPGVVERIVRAAEQGAGAMQSEERVVSVLFADIAGFTRYAEKLPPREVTAVLNHILGRLTAVVFEHGGTLDKFIGDAVMAFFGAPLDQPDHALRAVRTALGMQQAMAEFNAERAPEARLGLHIGVNTGPVVVGEIGAEQRMDYTVIGDAVNVASRLQSTIAAPGQVVIGEATHAAVGDAFDCEPLPPAPLKGRSAPFQPYRVRGVRAMPDAAATADAADTAGPMTLPRLGPRPQGAG